MLGDFYKLYLLLFGQLNEGGDPDGTIQVHVQIRLGQSPDQIGCNVQLSHGREVAQIGESRHRTHRI